MTLDLLSESLEPLVAHLDVRCLARLATSCRSLMELLRAPHAAPLWSCASAAMGLVEAHTRAAAVNCFHQRCVFSRDTAFGAHITGGRIILELGSGMPATRRVAAASSMVSLCKSKLIAFDVSVDELEYNVSRHHVLLWLGVLINHGDGRVLDSQSLPDVLLGYDLPTGQSRSMLERFAGSGWAIAWLDFYQTPAIVSEGVYSEARLLHVI